MGLYSEGRGGAPQELIDVSLCERFGWTWQELDEQDEARVLPAVGAANVYAALGRVNAWMVRASQPGQQNLNIDPADMAMAAAVKQARSV